MKKLIGGGLAALALGASLMSAGTANADTPYYNSDTVSQFIAAVNYEADRYHAGHVPVYVAHIDGDPNIMAETLNGEITINSNWAALTPSQFDAYVNKDIASGWTPSGCEGIQAIATHEMGHVIDDHGGQVARRTVTRAVYKGQVGGTLHGYAFNSDGSINPVEAIAVSFQAVECGSATPTERSIYSTLVSW